MRFGVKLALLFVLIGLVPLVIQGMLTYLQSQRALIHSARSHVVSVGVLKEDELLQWMDGNLATLKSVATRPLLIELSGQLANVRWGSEEWFAYHDDLVQNHLYPNLTARGLQNYQVIDPATGRILAATTPKYEGTFSESEDFLIEGLVGTYIGRVEYTTSEEELVMHVSTPIRANDWTTIGVLSAQVNLDEMGRILRLSSGAHASEDTYVINDLSYFATEPKFGKEYALRRTVHSDGAEASLRGESGVAIYKDYRDILVIGSYRWIEQLGLGLLVEVDWAEAIAPIMSLRRAMIAIGVVVALAVLGVSATLARGIIQPIRRLTRGTEEIGRGNLQYQIPTKGRDELSRLGASFNQMAESLRHVTASRDELDQEVQARASAEGRLENTVRALEESELKFRLLTDASPVGVFIFKDMVLKYVNPMFEEIFGYSSDEIVDRLGPMDITHPEDHELARDYIGQCYAGIKNLPPCSFVGIRKDGSHIHCEIMGRPIDYEGGVAILGTMVDATERMKTQEELRLKNTVFEASIAANSTADVNGIITHANASFVRNWGYDSEEDVTGLPISHFLAHENEAIAIVTALNETGEWEGDFEAIRNDGSMFTCSGHATVLRNEAGELIGYQSTNLDVSAQRRTETDLRQAKEITDSIIESIPGVFYQISREGKFERWNDSFERVTGYSSDEISRMHPLDFFRGDDKESVAVAIKKVYTHGRAEVIAEFMTKSGEGIPYLFTGVLKSINDTPYLIGMGTDISQLRNVEAQLRESMVGLEQSNTELEQFAYVASHDLQEPLRMISSYTQLLERRYKDALDDDARDFIAFAVDGANRMQRLINDLLMFSRIQTRGLSFELVDLAEVLGRAQENLKVAIDESKAMVTNEVLPMVMVDEGQLTSVFQNLLSNAIKFRSDETPRIHVGVTDQGAAWEISVQDNGIGINPDFFDRIFVIFQRLHTRDEHPGTGIGLALCKRIIERHGGRIWVESKAGQGTRFCLTIPKRLKEAE